MPRIARAPLREALLHAGVLTALAFGLHFVWESAQCPLFFVHGSYDASRTGMLRATLGDVGLTWLIYIVPAGISGRWRWTAGRWGWPKVLALIVIATALSIAIEARALANGSWRYKELTPLVPGTRVSVLPVLQLLLLTPLVFAGADRMTKGRAND